MDSKKLAAAVRNTSVLNDPDDVRYLLKTLAHIVEGMPIEKAFGSPGDWGYDTPIGDALTSRG
jgi:hypothetical protein